ncbi:hypothetical protein ACVWZ3_008470 [Bradyrhizobium sp. i1.3.6]
MIAVSVRQDNRTQGWIFDAKPGHRREKIVGRAVGIQRKAKVEQDSLARGLELDAGATNLLRSAVDTSAKRTGCFGHQRLVLAAEPGSAVTRDQANGVFGGGEGTARWAGKFQSEYGSRQRHIYIQTSAREIAAFREENVRVVPAQHHLLVRPNAIEPSVG